MNMSDDFVTIVASIRLKFFLVGGMIISFKQLVTGWLHGSEMDDETAFLSLQCGV